MIGQTKEDAQRDRAKRDQGHDITKAGIYQASSWITGQFPNPDQPKAWLKQRRPDVYAELFPGESDAVADAPSTAPRQRPRGEAAEDADVGGTAGSGEYKGRFAVGDEIKDYLT